MTARQIAALPVYGVGYGLLIACGIIAALGSLILRVGDFIVTHKRAFKPWERSF